MDVKEAVSTAKGYVAELFAEEGMTDLGLEEVVFEEVSGDWKVTVGFSRSWKQLSGLSAALAPGVRNRSYKVIRIRDQDGHVISLTDRQIAGRIG